jgi:hypothetical protein
MSTLIFILCFLAIFHFVYEGILAPSFRLKLRFELFELRDEVRQIKIEHKDKLNDVHFDYLQDSVNTLISILYKFDFATLALAESVSRSDPEFKKRAEERSRLLDDCQLDQARNIRKKSLKIAAKALLVNSGASTLYLFPIAMGLAGYSALKKRIKMFASLSEPDFKKVSIDVDNAALCPS